LHHHHKYQSQQVAPTIAPDKPSYNNSCTQPLSFLIIPFTILDSKEGSSQQQHIVWLLYKKSLFWYITAGAPPLTFTLT
jgi:hypothetical protein